MPSATRAQRLYQPEILAISSSYQPSSDCSKAPTLPSAAARKAVSWRCSDGDGSVATAAASFLMSTSAGTVPSGSDGTNKSMRARAKSCADTYCGLRMLPVPNGRTRRLCSDASRGLSKSALVTTAASAIAPVPFAVASAVAPAAGVGSAAVFALRSLAAASAVHAGFLTASCSCLSTTLQAPDWVSGPSSIDRSPVSRYFARIWNRFDRLSVTPEHSSDVVANNRTSPTAAPNTGEPNITDPTQL